MSKSTPERETVSGGSVWVPALRARSRLLVGCLLAGSMLAGAGGAQTATGQEASAKPPAAQPLPSTYAPAADLVGQLESYLASLQQDLSDAASYGQEQQDRVAKDASTVAVLALVLGRHDQPHKLKAAAPAMLKAAEALAGNAEKVEAAQADLARLKAAAEAPGTAASDDAPREWTAVGDIGQLMRQVPIVNNNLRRGVTGRRFDRTQEQNAGYAATLAALAQVSAFNTDYCADEEDERTWARICHEMRDAAADVQRAIRQGDQATATKGLARLVETCDACHHKFRD